MKIFFKHIIRNIKENIGRTSLIIISLFGVAAIISLGFGLSFTLKDFIDSMNSMLTSGYNYVVTSNTDADLTTDRVNETGVEFEQLGIVRSEQGYIINPSNKKYDLNLLLGMDIDQAIKMEIISFKKEENIKLSDNEIIISSSVASKYKLKVNDVIEYYDEDKEIHKLTVKSIAEDKGVFLEGNSFVTNENTYKNIINKDKIKYEYIYLKYTGKKNIDKLLTELNAVEDDYGLDFRLNSINSKSNSETVIKTAIIIFLVVIMVVYFTLNSIVKIIINERIPVIGTFRSIGASKNKMNFILIMEMATYGIIGGALGSIAGVGFFKLMSAALELTGEMMGIPIKLSSGNAYSFLVIFLTIICLILFQLSLSIAEILRASKLSIKESIFNKHESLYKYSPTKLIIGIFFLITGVISLVLYKKLLFGYSVVGILSLFISLALLLPTITRVVVDSIDKSDNPTMKMAKHTIVHNKLQINTNVIVSVMMCVSLIAFSLLNYTLSTYKSTLDMIKSDLYLMTVGESFDTVNEIRAIDGVDRVSTLYTDNLNWYYNSITFANNEVDGLTLLYSDDYTTLVKDSNVIELDAKLANNLKDNEVILSDYYKEKYGFKIGDIIVINGIREEERFDVEVPMNLKIVGFADTKNVKYNSIILSEKMIFDLVTVFSDMKYYIQLEDNANVKEVEKAIMKSVTYEMATLQTQEEYIKYTKELMEELYFYIALVILIIIGVSLIGIINNQSVSFLERKKEMAVLYSTAMSREQLNKMIIIEMTVSYIISSIVSVIFSIMLIKLLKYTLDLLGIYLPMKFSLIGILILLVIIGIIMSVIYLVMKRKIRKMNIVEELKYE